MINIQCSECGGLAGPIEWRCKTCGGSLDLVGLPLVDPASIDASDFSLWRYRAMLPVERRFSLGEGMTPLVPVELDGARFYAKLEYLNPTGSFKDRGTTTMLNHLAACGVTQVIDNSSGNAGASLAAFAAVGGMEATVFVPAATAVESKKRLIRSFGGVIIESRDYLADVYRAAEATTYASHAWSPYFVLGQQTVAWETWEQLGQRAPDAIATPVGHGGLFLGFYRGFKALRDAGLIDRVPRMIAVQSAGVDPVVRGWEANAAKPPRIQPGHSAADGILVDRPVRGRQILQALYDTDGFALRVDNEAITAARNCMRARGLMIETTSAVTAAALPQIIERIDADADLALAFTGSGLKDIGGSKPPAAPE
ncbi:MAG: pyridoxal-phosphate dependent enzyme [Chloroflexota bacterium]|nr:pyridoxal-phosphate dependent enzyme [Chloroflexota bacterium]